MLLQKTFGKVEYTLLFAFLMVMATLAAAAPALAGLMAETLDVGSLVDPDSLFGYANLLITALGGIVVVIIGFKLAGVVIRFLLGAFDSLRF